LKQSKNLHLLHDTRFRQDLCKINKLEPATRDNLDWFEFGYRECMTRLPRQAKDLSEQHVDHKQDRAKSNQSKLGNKSVTWIKHEKVKFKATHGNLMNILDLSKSNRADN
jgi:hypothetical protein